MFKKHQLKAYSEPEFLADLKTFFLIENKQLNHLYKGTSINKTTQ